MPMWGSPVSYTDPTGLFVFIPPAIAWGVPIIAGAWWAVTHPIGGPVYAKPPENTRDPDGPKAPGKPSAEDGFKDPKGGENWVPSPDGNGRYGWGDKGGRVWCPTGTAGSPGSGTDGPAYGGPHWDVIGPGPRDHTNIYRGGKQR